MPYPKNLETALEVEAIVRDNGAVPATIAILDGIPCVGLYTELVLLCLLSPYFLFKLLIYNVSNCKYQKFWEI